MRRCLLSAVTTFLVVAFVIQGAQAQPPPVPQQTKPSWFQGLWPFKKKKAPEPEPAVKTSSPESAAALQAREKANYLRRIAVCDRLRDIAFQTKDNELFRKADQLDQRAYAIYMKHSAQVPGDMALQADERILEQRLGSTAPAGQAVLPAQRASGSQASRGEE